MKRTGPWTMLQAALLLAAMFLVRASPALAAGAPGDGSMCQQAIASAERGAHLPARLLTAISVVESGRPDPHGGAIVAWPWTIDVAGTGHFYDNEADAIAAVQAAQQSGVQSIDVGCMQINLLHHPHAFASLSEAFDPETNVRYAATFLQLLYHQTNAWGMAVADYHSSTPDLGAEYGQRVAAIWPLASRYGLPMVATVAAVAAGPTPAQLVDPQNVLTPEFRAKLVADMAFKQRRDAAMGLTAPLGSSASLLAQRGAGKPARLHGRLLQASLGANSRD